jgi:hypothetical protein
MNSERSWRAVKLWGASLGLWKVEIGGREVARVPYRDIDAVLSRLRDEKNEAQRQEHMAKAEEERLRRLILKAAEASDPRVALDRLAQEALDG